MKTDATYPKGCRLRRKGEYRRVMARAEVFPGREALVRRARNRLGLARLGVSVPRAYGEAVRRNRFRRLAREAFRAVRHDLGPYDFVLSPRRHLEEPTLAGILQDLERTRTEAPLPPREPGRREAAS